MTKRTILFLSSWYPNKKAPTLGNFVERHAQAISSKNKVVLLFATSIENQIEDFVIDKQFSENLSEYIVYYKKPSSRLAQFLWVFRALNFGFEEVLKRNNVDFVHLNVIRPLGFYAFYLKYFKKIKYVITEHWTGFLPSNNYFEKLPFFEKNLIRVIGKNAEAIFPVTLDLAKNMGLKGIANNYYPIPNVVNQDDFFPTNEKENYFLHVSHLKQDHKNIFGILNAFSKVLEANSSLRLKVVGDEDKNHVKEKIAELRIGNNVDLLGPLNSDEIAKLMQKALTFILFSNYENLPCVLEEAQMCGCRIISTNVGGIVDYFENNGVDNIIIESKKEEDLTKAMLQFSEIELDFERVNSRAALAKNRFSIPAIANQYEMAYKKLNL